MKHMLHISRSRLATSTFSSFLRSLKSKTTLYTTFIMSSFARNIRHLTNVAPFLPRLIFSLATSMTEKSVITTDIAWEKTVMFQRNSLGFAKLLSELCSFNRFCPSCRKMRFQLRKWISHSRHLHRLQRNQNLWWCMRKYKKILPPMRTAKKLP